MQAGGTPKTRRYLQTGKVSKEIWTKKQRMNIKMLARDLHGSKIDTVARGNYSYCHWALQVTDVQGHRYVFELTSKRRDNSVRSVWLKRVAKRRTSDDRWGLYIQNDEDRRKDKRPFREIPIDIFPHGPSLKEISFQDIEEIAQQIWGANSLYQLGKNDCRSFAKALALQIAGLKQDKAKCRWKTILREIKDILLLICGLTFGSAEYASDKHASDGASIPVVSLTNPDTSVPE